MTTTEFNTLQFPSDRAIGWIKIPRRRQDPHNHWKLVGQARGRVQVPQNTPVRLIVEPSAASAMAWLEAIEHHQLTELYLGQTDITNDSIRHIKHLEGLEVLSISHVYERISDIGAQYIQYLPHLRELYLNATDIGDLTLAYLQGMHQLERLSIGATQVTDFGLASLYTLSQLKHISVDHAYSGRSNHMSQEGLNQLSLALPRCIISTHD